MEIRGFMNFATSTPSTGAIRLPFSHPCPQVLFSCRKGGLKRRPDMAELTGNEILLGSLKA